MAASSAAKRAAQTPVLVAEDNPVTQQVIVRMLEKRGYRVDLATTGWEAVDATQRSRYTMIFMDCLMPEMGGYAAATAIRSSEQPGDRHTPIIALTANAQSDSIDAYLAAGMNG